MIIDGIEIVTITDCYPPFVKVECDSQRLNFTWETAKMVAEALLVESEKAKARMKEIETTILGRS